MGIKSISALICSIFISIGLNLTTPDYFIAYFMVSGIMYLIFGISISYVIDSVIHKFKFSRVGRSIMSIFVYSFAGAIIAVIALSLFDKSEHIIWGNVMALGAISGLLFYIVQLLVYSISHMITKRRSI